MDDKDYELKKREQNLNFWKFVLGTFLLGLAANVINYYLQQSKIDLDVRVVETNDLQENLDRYMQIGNYDDKLEFLKFISIASQSSEVRCRYDSLHDYLVSAYNEKEDINEEIDDIASSTDSSIIEEIARYARIEETETPEDGITIDIAREKLDSIFSEDPQLTNASKLVDEAKKIDRKLTLTTDKLGKEESKVSEEFKTISHKDQWLKENYFRVYENYYLAVMVLKNSNVKFQLRRVEAVNTEVVKTFTLEPGQVENIIDNEIQFRLNLNGIGRAGRNPFTKAALYDLTVTKKDA